MAGLCKTDPGRAAGGEQRETVITVLQLFSQFFCLFHNGQVGTDTGIIYRIKTEHADGGENPADAVFAGLEAEGFTQGNADSGATCTTTRLEGS